MKKIFSSIFLYTLVSLLVLPVRCSYASYVQQGFEQYKQEYEAINDRFGLGGGCGAAQELGATWVSNWGHGSQYANQGEEDCFRYNGSKFFYTVGDQQNDDYSDPNNPYSIEILKNTYLYDQDEKNTYEALEGLIAQMAVTKPDWNKKDNTLSSYLLIPKYAKDTPGATYIVGTEPERTIGDTTEAAALYAQNYHFFYERVKKYDPSARVAVGKLIGIQGGDFTWIDTFRKEYNELFGSYPPVDVWAVNPYTYPWELHLHPDATKFFVGLFYDYLTSIGEAGKPIWWTEYGIASWEGELTEGVAGVGIGRCEKHNCLSEMDREKEQEKAVEEYMLPIFAWLNEEGGARQYNIERWFWTQHFDYSWFTDPNGVWWLGNLSKNEYGEYNPQGIAFQKSTRQPILANRGFESSILKSYGWWFWDGSAGSSLSSIDTNEKHDGRMSAKVQVGPTPGQFGSLAALVQTIRSTDYAGKYVRASAWCKTANGGSAGLKINITHADGNREAYWAPSVVPPSSCADWKKIQTSVVQIPDDVISLEVDLGASGQNGTVWFDDVSLDYVRITVGVEERLANHADADGDGVINDVEYQVWLSHYNQHVSGAANGDFDDSGLVDGVDYIIWLNEITP